MERNNPNLDLVHINVITKFCHFCLFLLKILSRNTILTSLKFCNSATNLWKMTGNNPNTDLVNISVYTKYGQIMSIHSQNIEQKRNSGINQGL